MTPQGGHIMFTILLVHFMVVISEQVKSLLTDVHCKSPFFRSFRIVLSALFLFLNTLNGLNPT